MLVWCAGLVTGHAPGGLHGLAWWSAWSVLTAQRLASRQLASSLQAQAKYTGIVHRQALPKDQANKDYQ